MDITLLSAAQVAEKLGVSRRTVWRLVSLGTLPKPMLLSARCARWRASDVAAALEKLLQ